MSPQSLDYSRALAEVSAAVEGLSRALRPILEKALPERSGPRSCGRALGLSVTTGWRCWSIAHSTDPAVVLRWLPGRVGWQEILRGLAARGASEAELVSLRAAIERLREAISSHQIRPSMLRSIAAGGLDSERLREGMIKARRDAGRAAATIYGIRAKAVLGGFALGAPDSKRRIALASFALTEGLARLRPGPAWPIFERTCTFKGRDRRRLVSEHGEPEHRLPPLLDDLSTPGIAGTAIRLGERSVPMTLDFDEPPEGETAIRASFLEVTPNAGTMGRDERNLNLRMPLKLPIGIAIFDVLLHRDLGLDALPAAAMYGTASMWGEDPAWGAGLRLPLESEAQIVESPALPRSLREAEATYRRLLERAVVRVRARLADFTIHRLAVSHPPMHPTLLLRWD